MKKVCVITGGGSGMGLATAKLVCEEGYYTILVGRTASKLEKAVNDLRSAGGEAEAFSCDVSDRESCFALAKHAAECGEVKRYCTLRASALTWAMLKRFCAAMRWAQ